MAHVDCERTTGNPEDIPGQKSACGKYEALFGACRRLRQMTASSAVMLPLLEQALYNFRISTIRAFIGSVNTAAFIAGNRRGQVLLLRSCAGLGPFYK